MNDTIIGLARAAIYAALDQPEDFDLEHALEAYPALKENGAAFVTLNKGADGQLRGCIGSLHATRPLYQDIIANAQAAALHDPRFRPLASEELSQITLEVSILSKPEPVAYVDEEELKSKIVPFKDGIVLKHHGRQATYLPQVWEQLPDFDDFFSSLCLKANLDRACLSEHPEIWTYTVKKYKESR